MTGRTLLGGLGLLLLVAGCGAATAGDGASADRPDGRMVLVSGRDDHGFLAQDTVPLYAEPASTDRVGRIADDTLAHVAAIDGTWLHVVAAEGEAASGWVDDFFLRGVVHLVGPAPSCAAAVAGRDAAPGLQVAVRSLRGGEVLVEAVDGSARGWADRAAVQELGPQGDDCGDDPPGAKHTH